MSKVLFIDADECLLDWLGGFCDYYNSHVHSIPEEACIYPSQFTDYGMTCFPGGEPARQQWMKEFSHSEEFRDLKAMCQMTSLEALKNVGYELHVLTARHGEHADMRSILVHNLTRHYGPVCSGVHFCKGSKLEFMRLWGISGKGYAVGLIDDKPDTLREIVQDETGFRAFGVMHEFNRAMWERSNSTDVYWAKSVDQIAELLIREATSE